jgi:hypothetical protein
MSRKAFVIALGVLLGNWILSPFIATDRTHTDGFFIGFVAAIIVLVIFVIFDRNDRP